MSYFNKPASVALPSDLKQGLYHLAFERDSCGVGLAADMSGSGQLPVVRAIAEVRKAARRIDHDLTGEASTLRVRDRSWVQIEPQPLAVPGS